MERDTSTGNQTTGTTDGALCERLEALEAKVEEQQETIEEQQETIEDLTDRLNKSENATGYAHERVDKIESGASGSADANGGVRADKNPVQADELTPLGQTVTLPEHAVDSLTENQERARFVARDIQQYADMRLGELVISSGDIRKVLSAKEETSIHWETVSRVIDFLDSMGKNATTVKDKHGTIVCFDPAAVKKWSRPTHGVVSGDRGEV